MLLKGTIGKIISQEGILLNFQAALMKVVLPFTVGLIKPLANSVSIYSSNISNRWTHSKENFCIEDDYIDNLKRRNERYHGNSWISLRSGLLMKVVWETTENEAKNKKVDFLAC